MLINNVTKAADYISAQTSLKPKIALILGSGLGGFAAQISGVRIPYKDIPGFPVSTAPTHSGVLHIGELHGQNIIAMEGRLHMYEGYSPQEIIFPLRVMAALKAESLIVTNAAGGINTGYKAGDIVFIDDHLSLPGLAGADPTRGTHDKALGPRFTPLNKAYSPPLLKFAQSQLEAMGEVFKTGVYGFVVGPSLETPAEVRALRTLGCDLVGMSTVPEVIAARQMGLEVLAFSAVANMAIDNINNEAVTCAADVFKAMEAMSPKLHMLLNRLISHYPESPLS